MQACWHLNYAGTKSRWHVDHVGMEAHMECALANSLQCNVEILQAAPSCLFREFYNNQKEIKAMKINSNVKPSFQPLGLYKQTTTIFSRIVRLGISRI